MHEAQQKNQGLYIIGNCMRRATGEVYTERLKVQISSSVASLLLLGGGGGKTPKCTDKKKHVYCNLYARTNICPYKLHTCRLTCTDKFPIVPTKLRKSITPPPPPLWLR